MVYAQPRIGPGEWDAISSQGFKVERDHLMCPRQQDLLIVNNQKKKRAWQPVDFVVKMDHGVKIKESDKRDKYLDPATELKKRLRNMNLVKIPHVVCALGTILKSSVKALKCQEIRCQVETLLTTVSSQSTRILRGFLGTWEEYCNSKPLGRTIS